MSQGGNLGGWVVDTCIVIDVLRKDPLHGMAVPACLMNFLPRGLSCVPCVLLNSRLHFWVTFIDNIISWIP